MNTKLCMNMRHLNEMDNVWLWQTCRLKASCHTQNILKFTWPSQLY